MTVTLGENNLPSNIVSDGTIGKKDGTYTYSANGNAIKEVSTSADGSVETVETQYVLTYLEIDVPKQTMDQLWEILTVRT